MLLQLILPFLAFFSVVFAPSTSTPISRKLEFSYDEIQDWFFDECFHKSNIKTFSAEEKKKFRLGAENFWTNNGKPFGLTGIEDFPQAVALFKDLTNELASALQKSITIEKFKVATKCEGKTSYLLSLFDPFGQYEFNGAIINSVRGLEKFVKNCQLIDQKKDSFQEKITGFLKRYKLENEKAPDKKYFINKQTLDCYYDDIFFESLESLDGKYKTLLVESLEEALQKLESRPDLDDWYSDYIDGKNNTKSGEWTDEKFKRTFEFFIFHIHSLRKIKGEVEDLFEKRVEISQDYGTAFKICLDNLSFDSLLKKYEKGLQKIKSYHPDHRKSGIPSGTGAGAGTGSRVGTGAETGTWIKAGTLGKIIVVFFLLVLICGIIAVIYLRKSRR